MIRILPTFQMQTLPGEDLFLENDFAAARTAAERRAAAKIGNA